MKLHRPLILNLIKHDL